MPIAEFRFEYIASDKNKQGPAVETALGTVRGVLEEVRSEHIKRELLERADARVEVVKKQVHEKPLALHVTFELVENVRHRQGNVVQIYKALQAVERRTDEYLYYLIRGAREDANWFDNSGLKKKSNIVSTAGFINRTERVNSRFSGLGYGVVIGAAAAAYGLNYQAVNGWVGGLMGGS